MLHIEGVTSINQLRTMNHWYVIETILYTIIKIFFTWDLIYAVCFRSFCIFHPPNYLGYFDQRKFHLLTTQSVLWRQGIKLEVL